jgi:hypothetical protein
MITPDFQSNFISIIVDAIESGNGAKDALERMET